MKEKIRAYFSENSDQIRKKSLDFLKELIAVKSINAGKSNLKEYPEMECCGEESKVVEVLKKYLDKEGFKSETHELIKGRSNLISSYGEGEKGLCVGCHSDIVPAGDLKLWDTDPFVMMEKDGFVYARGTLDNKGPMVSSIMALEALKNLGIKLKGKFMFAAIAGEEFHEKDEPDPGIEFLLKKGHLKPTYAIIPDIGENLKRIDVAEKGRLVIRVTSIGVQAHGSTPELGINAVYKMAEFLTGVDRMQLSYEPHDILIEPTVNLGVIRGGVVANSVADTCEAVFDIRFLPGQTAEGIIAEFKKCTEGIKDGKFEFEIEDLKKPHEVDPKNELIGAIQENTEAVMGFRPVTFGLGGGTFAKGFNLGGIVAVGFGPGDDKAFHVSNEYLEIGQMLKFAEILACVAIDLLGCDA